MDRGLNRLNHDLLVRVLSCIRSLDNLMNCSLVSKHLQAAARSEQLWEIVTGHMYPKLLKAGQNELGWRLRFKEHHHKHINEIKLNQKVEMIKLKSKVKVIELEIQQNRHQAAEASARHALLNQQVAAARVAKRAATTSNMWSLTAVKLHFNALSKSSNLDVLELERDLLNVKCREKSLNCSFSKLSNQLNTLQQSLNNV